MPADNSSTVGALIPLVTGPLPLYDQALDRFLQQLAVSLTALDGALVRPRWQTEPGNRPAITVDWAAIGVLGFENDAYSSIVHDPEDDGVDKWQRGQKIEVMATFYGPNSGAYAAQFSDGLLVPQNREVLQLAGMGLYEAGDPTQAPELIKELWHHRWDVRFVLSRMVKREYAVFNLEEATLILQAAYLAAQQDVKPVSVSFEFPQAPQGPVDDGRVSAALAFNSEPPGPQVGATVGIELEITGAPVPLASFSSSSAVVIAGGSTGEINFSDGLYLASYVDDGTITLTLLRQFGSQGTAMASVAVSGGSATLGIDYTVELPVGFVWADGQQGARSFTVTLLDGWLETKTIEFELIAAGAVTGSIGVTELVVTLGTLDAGVFNFTSPTFSVSEDAETYELTVSRSDGNDAAVSVDVVAVVGGSAVDGVDYEYVTQTLNWANTESGIKTATVTILDNSASDPDRTVFFQLQNAAGGTIGVEDAATLTITSEDVAGSLQFTSATFDGDAGTSIAISVSRTGGSDGAVSVDYTTSDGTAVAPGDYTETSGTLSWADDDVANKSFNVPTSAAVDGVWTTRTSAADNTWTSIAWSDVLDLFVAVSYTGSTIARGMTSPDGVTWTLRTTPASTTGQGPTLKCVTYGAGLFVGVSDSTNFNGSFVITSPDGITWTQRNSAGNQSANSVAWSGSIFAAVGSSKVSSSPDGITWTSRTPAANNNWTAVCWSNDLNLFVAVSDTGAGDRVMTSPDGVTWTSRVSATDSVWSGIAWSPELGLFAAVGGAAIMTSPDGITWTPRTSPTSDNWRGVTWSAAAQKFVGVGSTVAAADAKVLVSVDGITWTTETGASDNDWNAVIESPSLGRIVAVSGSGTANRVMTKDVASAKTFNVTLSNPTGDAAIGSPAAATVTINP